MSKIKRKNNNLQSQILKDFEKLFTQQSNRQKSISKNIKNEFKKLIEKENIYNKTRIAKNRRKVTHSKKTTFVKKFNQVKKRVELKKLNLDYQSFQKDFLLSAPIKVTKKMIEGDFLAYLEFNFRHLISDYFSQNKWFTKNRNYVLATIGYHFFFKKGNVKSYQSGYRMPRKHLTKNNIDQTISELFNPTFERFNAYFATKGNSQLYFEGLTGEISYDN